MTFDVNGRVGRQEGKVSDVSERPKQLSLNGPVTLLEVIGPSTSQSANKELAVQNQNPAMTFAEIGRRLGITRQAAEHTCKRGLEKIRRNAAAMENFKALFHEGNKERHESWPMSRW